MGESSKEAAIQRSGIETSGILNIKAKKKRQEDDQVPSKIPKVRADKTAHRTEDMIGSVPGHPSFFQPVGA